MEVRLRETRLVSAFALGCAYTGEKDTRNRIRARISSSKCYEGQVSAVTRKIITCFEDETSTSQARSNYLHAISAESALLQRLTWATLRALVKQNAKCKCLSTRIVECFPSLSSCRYTIRHTPRHELTAILYPHRARKARRK